MFSQAYKSLGYQQITSLSSAATLTVPAGANLALITVEAQNARWRDDGTAPTATVGQLMKTTDNPLEFSGNLAAIQFIQATGGAILNVSYYKAAG